MNGAGTARLYGSAIALVSGAYSAYLALAEPGSGPAWLMLALGLVVFGHGLALLTPLAARLGAASGPLMIVYALLMLANQAWMWSMRGSMRMDGMGSSAMWDPGMVAVALVMLASGVIMTTRSGSDAGRRMAMDGE